MKQFILFSFLFINFLAILFFYIDKRRATKGNYRISEKTLLTLCAVGGSVGGFIAMQLFRHKTQKRSFLLPFYLIVSLQIAIGIYIGAKYNNLI
ncbi:DUF1294 domain-containing protein [Sphingobacterium sp. SRCM116780]|uniref:DUF1294 domain-containing protein n=1 Tax=Sphingobacterium sp. SRCM116780 TaxID=2907623 RepID=UPI001F392CC5|nr:DUF1294 domain-containing protein [Sphingobacterium sp. SRCM116780]UIR55664.1 DUF1294 domain-containing protein [Sphingobacterium sp. SRCM116780]